MRKLILSSKWFSWDKHARTFVTEASRLEHEMQLLGFDRLNYENGEWGFHMKSVRTQAVIWFKRDHEQRGQDGELQAIVFTSIHVPGVRVVVLND